MRSSIPSNKEGVRTPANADVPLNLAGQVEKGRSQDRRTSFFATVGEDGTLSVTRKKGNSILSNAIDKNKFSNEYEFPLSEKSVEYVKPLNTIISDENLL
jgi:hypothetical protein